MGSNGPKIDKYTQYTYQKNANGILVPNMDISRSFEVISRVMSRVKHV